MSSGKWKLPRARVAALAVGLAAAGSLATAPASFAAGASPKPPAIGANCQQDGKINGAGSTFQTNALNNAFTFTYQNDVCGAQPNSTNLQSLYGSADPSIYSFTVGSTTDNVQGMVAYNYSLGNTASTNGSGAGLKRTSCRTDMFGGTDLPYNSTQLGTPGSAGMAGLDGPPGSETGGSGPSYGCDTQTNINTSAVPPPFGPQPDTPSTPAYPNTSDAAANVMGLPVAAGAVAFGVNFNGVCTTLPTSLQLTAAEMDGIWQGTINQWTDSTLDANNPQLSSDGCQGNIQRVVRFDNSGTTSITMNTLYGEDNGVLCGTDNASHADLRWYDIGTMSSNQNNWPEANGTSPDCVDTGVTPNTSAPNPVTSGSNGSQTLITKLLATSGGIGYAELGLWPSPLPSGVVFAQVQNAAGTAFVSPGSPGSKSNCSLPAAPPTGTTAAAAVGLGATTWSNTGTGAEPVTPGKQDIADTGTGYPACGLTFDLVYTGQSEAGEIASPSGGPATAGCVIPAGSTTADVDQTLPESTLTVISTAGFPSSGTLSVVTSTGTQNLTYTGKTGASFTGVAGGTAATISAGAAVSVVSTTAPQAGNATPGVNGGCQTVGGSMAGVTNDQERTMYSYFTYVFSPLGQTFGGLPSQTLDPLPATWLNNLTQGFQQNF